MINSITNAYKASNVQQSSVVKKESSEPLLKYRADTLDKTKSTVGIETYYFKDLVSSGKLKSISDDFRTSDASIMDNQVAIYDISNYQDIFPYELENGKVFSHLLESEIGNFTAFDVWSKGPNGPFRMQVQIPCGKEKTQVLDEATFKNTILKSLAISLEHTKCEEEAGIGVAADYAGLLPYNSATKIVDFAEVKKQLLSNFDFYTDGTITSDFRKQYTGYRNLDADLSKVAEGKKHFQSIFDELMKLKL